MPASTGQGYQVSVLPQVQQVDPRLFNNAGQFLGGLNTGLGTVGALQNIYDQAQMAPVRRRLADIQIEEAQNRLSLAPLDRQLRDVQLAEAQQNAAVPREVLDDSIVTGGGRLTQIANPDAGFGNLEFVDSFAPRNRVVTGTRYGAGGIATPFSRTETLATPEQLKAEAAKTALGARTAESMIDSREAAALAATERNRLTAERDTLRAENAKILAESAMIRAQAYAENPNYKSAPATLDDNGNVVLNFVDATGALHAVPTGQRRSATSTFNFFGGGARNGTATAKPAVVSTVGVDPAIVALSNLAGGATPAAAVAAEVPTLTVEQATLVPAGTIFIGIDGKRRQKNANGTVSIVQ